MKSRANQNNTLFSKRMYAIKKDGTFDKFPDFFGVSKAKFSRFLSGEGSPTLGQYGDMYRLGQSIGNAGQAQMNWAMQNYEDEAQAQAINSLHAYFLKMDRIKIKLINDKHKR